MFSPQNAPLPRHQAVLILLCLGCIFAGNHVAARVAFDSGAGVLLAILMRSGGALLALIALLLWQRQRLYLPADCRLWQLLLGLLIAIQSLCLYSAVARIPVAMALLVANVFPLLLALFSWALGGPRPSARQAALMGVILCGLLLVLDIPAQLRGQEVQAQWLAGVALAFCSACAFASALWITDHKLSQVRGSVRGTLTMLVVFGSAALIGTSPLPATLDAPGSDAGWLALFLLTILYGTGFISLFMLVPRLDMPRNASVMNIEPLATLLMAWLILGQTLWPIQILGGVIVVTGIVLLSRR